VLRRAKYSFRRARRILPKKPSAQTRAAAERALAKLRRIEQQGGCELFFGDESGFCLQPTVMRLWQPLDQTLGLPAQSHSKRLNAVGFWRESDNTLHFHTHLGRLGAAEFIEAVETKLLPHLQRPTVLVLDNARLHHSHLVKERLSQWRSQGLRLFFLPPYSPHLNPIEILWRELKYRWLPPTAYLNFQSLCDQVTTVLQHIGSKYRISYS
jgi:hypothetical protein